MAKTKLTETRVASIPPPKMGRVEHFDTLMPGLCLRVSNSGKRSFCVFYRYGGKLWRVTLGTCPPYKLVEAREDARLALLEVQRGNDPAAIRAERRASTSPLIRHFPDGPQIYCDDTLIAPPLE